MRTWESILEELIRIEGGFVDNPLDRGGPTKYGVTQATARRHGYTGPMQDLPIELARAIYAQDYWVGPGFALVHSVSPVIAVEMLDTGVNMGPGHPSRWLQRILNALNQKGTLYADLKVDGAIGIKTMQALGVLLEKRGMAGTKTVLTLLNALQGVRYLEIAEADIGQEAFLFGWIANRVQMP